jgi:SOS-response transcriptional repressor LexA
MFLMAMGRPKKANGALVSVTASIDPTIEREIDHLATCEERSRSYVVSKLLTRGYLAYKRDGKLNESEPEKERTGVVIPFARASAGSPIETEEEEFEISASMVAGARNPFAVRVHGRSMIGDGVFDRDILICETVGEGWSGKICVAEVEGEGVVVKRLQDRGARVTLHSSNPDFEARTILRNKVRVIGQVLHIIRSFKSDESENHLKVTAGAA